VNLAVRPRRALWVGVTVAAVYVVAVVATLGLHGTHARPLYEGFSPATPYRWVNPPAIFAATNQKPTSVTATVPMTAKGSAPAGIQTSDNQVILGLASGAVSPHGADRSLHVAVVPLDPAKLAPLPGGLYPNGNAYRISVTYEPSGQPVTKLTKPGSLTLEIPGIGRVLYTSPDGHTWNRVDAHNVLPTNLIMSTLFSTPGYYLGGTTFPPASPAGSSSSVVKVAVGAGALAVILLVATAVLVRRRRRRRRAA
jgi:uncharacterized protein (TIGR03382 family)